MDDHLIVNVEASIGRKLYEEAERLDQLAGDAFEEGDERAGRQWRKAADGYRVAGKNAIARSLSIPNDTDLAQLEPISRVKVTDEEIAEREREAEASAWRNLRDDRDALLAASDWTQLSDIPERVRKAWAEYRKALRDLPAATNTPREADWPEPPK